MIKNTDPIYLERITKAIEDNKGYCPCVLKKTDDTICPCKEFRENSKCLCKLYIEGEE